MWVRTLPRLIAVHGGAGFGISALFMGLILWGDPAGLAALLRHADGHPWPLLLLWFFCGLTFGSVQIGNAVMLLEDRSLPQRSEFHERERQGP